MKHVLRPLLILALVAFLPVAAQADLDRDIKNVLDEKLLAKATVGIAIARLADGPAAVPFYQHNSTKPLTPASNLKVLTTSAALDYFGPDYLLRTLLVQHGNDLILVGDGDATFGDNELLKKVKWDATTVFQTWAQRIKQADPPAFANVLVDDSIFDETFVQANWDPKQLHARFAAQISGMTLNVGCVDFHVHSNGPGKPVSFTTSPPTAYVTVHNTCVGGSDNAIILARLGDSNRIHLGGTCTSRNEAPLAIPIHDPALLAATTLAETFKAAGIQITGKVGRDRTVRRHVIGAKPDAGYVLVAAHETPLIQVINRANKDSMNLYAESLCKRLGAAVGGESGSWINGPAAVSAFLKKVGVADDQYHIDDGCGWSRENSVSAAAMLRVLQYNYVSVNRDAFIGSLPIAGHDGTLDNRFKGSDLRGRVFAKTGFINNVSALSGYLKAKNDQWYAFSILINGIPAGTNGRVKELQEKIVKAIDVSAGKAK